MYSRTNDEKRTRLMGRSAKKILDYSSRQNKKFLFNWLNVNVYYKTI